MIEYALQLSMLIFAFFQPVILAVWFFGLRPYVARHGRTRVVAANWFYSMWADWSTATEIAKATGRPSWPARIFLGLWLFLLAVFGLLFLLAAIR